MSKEARGGWRKEFWKRGRKRKRGLRQAGKRRGEEEDFSNGWGMHGGNRHKIIAGKSLGI